MKKLLCFLLFSLLFIQTVSAKEMRFVQITDVMYQKSGDNALGKVIQNINKQKNIDFVVFTGDNIAKPDVQELRAFLKEAKKLKIPFYIVIGDKDVNKRRDLSKKQYAKYISKHVAFYKQNDPSYVFERKGLVFIVADGAKDVIPSTIGYYKDDVMNWLDSRLSEYSQKPVIILQHFPIVPPAKRENYVTYKADKYLELIAKHKNVKAVVSGHYGVNKEQVVDGVIHISTAPIPNYRVIEVVDYESNPTVWTEVVTVE